jgi:hypothetical protein
MRMADSDDIVCGETNLREPARTQVAMAALYLVSSLARSGLEKGEQTQRERASG